MDGDLRTSCARRCVVAFAGVVAFAAAAPAAPAAAPAGEASTAAAASEAAPGPAGDAGGGEVVKATPVSRDQKVRQLLDYLEADYAKKATSKYWVSRSMGVVSLARSPRPSATDKLLEIVEKDKHDVVRLLAWQAVLARTPDCDPAVFDRFARDTWAMAERGMFRGRMRTALLQVMAVTPPTDKSRRIWQALFSEASAWEPHDIPTLDALGDCLKAWRSPSLAASLVGMLTNKDHAVRAEYVLRRAGCQAPPALSLMPATINDPFFEGRAHPSSVDLWKAVRASHQSWFTAERRNWREVTKAEGGSWRGLEPLFVAPPVPLKDVDPDDAAWRQDLELANADLAQFEAAFVVDATASMGPVLEWMRRDVKRMADAFQMLCKEPVAVGITFYRDPSAGGWAVRHVPLTRKMADVERALKEMDAEGGGDVPEAVLEGLASAVGRNRWSKDKAPGSKVLILVGDAPPHAATIPQCVALAKRAAEEGGMRVYAAKVTMAGGKEPPAPPSDLASFDAIAEAGAGSTVAVEFRRPTPYPFINALGQEVDYKPIERPEVQLVVASPPGDASGERILAHVLADTISRKYRDRVEPLAHTVLAYCDPKSPPEVRKAWPANTRPYPRKNTGIKRQNR